MQSQRGLLLAVLDEVNAAVQTATHEDVCLLAQAQRLYFRHRLVGGKLAEEKEELRGWFLNALGALLEIF